MNGFRRAAFYHFDHLCRCWVFFEVVVLHCLFGGDSLGWVHDQELLQELERLAVGLDAVLFHVFDKVAVGIATKTSISVVSTK